MIQIRVDEKIYQKDPESTELGKRIVEEGIRLIDELGFEQFTFRKLSERIGSTEASIYRYFGNKHQLLIYLISWYWSWMEYRVNFETHNIQKPEDRLLISIGLLTDTPDRDNSFLHVNETVLHRIVVAESSKAYLHKDVDADNREGYFASYKRLTRKVADIIREVNAGYRYPESLVSTLIESSHNQTFFARHLPSLTNVHETGCGVSAFIEHLVFSAIHSTHSQS